jgi:ParB-like chromosome segregation protein Spo0J
VTHEKDRAGLGTDAVQQHSPRTDTRISQPGIAAVRFQALPPLSPDEYHTLEESILTHGVLVPIIVDEHDVVIDGHHRQKIAKHHNLPCPREVKAGFTDAEKRTMALSLNIDRRHLTREQRRALVAESVKADPQLSDREHGRRTGVSDKTAGAVRHELETNAEIPHSTDRTTADGRPAPGPKPKPATPRGKPITDAFGETVSQLARVTDRIEALSGDVHFAKDARVSDLIRARDAIDRVICKFDGDELIRHSDYIDSIVAKVIGDLFSAAGGTG